MNIIKFVCESLKVDYPFEYALFEIDGEIADIEEASRSEQELSLKLTTKGASGRLILSPAADLRIHFWPDEKNIAKNLGLILPFPLQTEFHVPERYNIGRMIDSEMPVGESYSTSRLKPKGLGYNFFLVNLKGKWLRFRTKQTHMTSADVQITRHPELFIVTFTWNAADESFISVFSSMDEAIQDFEDWMQKELSVKKLRNRPNLPEWIHNVKLVMCVDMMRSNWEITHDYNDVANLAKDLKKIGCPEDTLFYLAGWNGAFDSTYPTYRPHSKLGGEEKFKEMIDAIHENGFRVSIHTLSWGLDPYHVEIDKLEKYVRRDDEGKLQGWQTGRRIQAWGGGIFPPSKPLKFRTDKVQLLVPVGAKSFTFETVRVPDTCEALFTLGNLKVGNARVRFTVERRSMMSPPGWFKDHEEYAFPFPFLLKSGVNKVQVEVMGSVEPDWSESWYKIRYCFVPLTPHTPWSHPILLANIDDPEWIRIYVDEVASVVRKYSIDAVHVDDTTYFRAKRILHALREKLPDVHMGAEKIDFLEDLAYWSYSFGARVSLLSIADMADWIPLQGIFPDLVNLEKRYSWLDKLSPVCNFLKDYLYVVQSGGEAFVPVGKVINTFPPRLTPRSKEEIWRILRNSRRLNFIPSLKVNYRKYGIDEEARIAIQEIASN